ncbi:MAG: MazG family protein [Chloroflexota bacterium]
MGEAVAELARIAARLRAPDGCPWDREQTHASLRPNLLEEAYEALEAIDTGDATALRDELGDLLFQVVIHAQLAREEGGFDLGDVARGIADKLVRRHPHVFAGTELADGDVLAQWERIKREEHGQGEAGKERGSILEGIPRALPALFLAERLQERLSRIGVAPPVIDLPIDVDDAELLGEILFALVAEARAHGIDAETALRETNERFAARVRRMEERARAEGRELETYSPDETRQLWEATA